MIRSPSLEFATIDVEFMQYNANDEGSVDLLV